MSHLEKHYKKLLKVVKKFNIKYKRETGYDGSYAEIDYSPKKILIQSKTEYVTYVDVYYLLHELGHHIDDKKNPNRGNGANNYMYIRYDFSKKEWIERKSLPSWAKKSIINMEKRAWREAKRLAISLGIPAKKRFDDIRKKSLKTYTDIPEY